MESQEVNGEAKVISLTAARYRRQRPAARWHLSDERREVLEKGRRSRCLLDDLKQARRIMV